MSAWRWISILLSRLDQSATPLARTRTTIELHENRQIATIFVFLSFCLFARVFFFSSACRTCHSQQNTAKKSQKKEHVTRKGRGFLVFEKRAPNLAYMHQHDATSSSMLIFLLTKTQLCMEIILLSIVLLARTNPASYVHLKTPPSLCNKSLGVDVFHDESHPERGK